MIKIIIFFFKRTQSGSKTREKTIIKTIFFKEVLKVNNTIIEMIIDVFIEIEEKEEYKPEDPVTFLSIQNAAIFKEYAE